MKKEIKRVDGKTDEITNQTFQNYNDAYDLLTNIHQDINYSDENKMIDNMIK
tara:strand:+ start:517 stop:672 length:156 start_codon:yes stop_codon:yes gene_type:complete